MPLSSRLPHSLRLLLARFLLTSALATATSSAVIGILYGTHLLPAPAATLVGNLLAAPPAYVMTRRYAWKKTGPSHLTKEVLPFAAMTLVGLVVSTLFSALLAPAVRTHASHPVATLAITAANLASYAIVWVAKVVVFNRAFAPVERPPAPRDVIVAGAPEERLV